MKQRTAVLVGQCFLLGFLSKLSASVWAQTPDDLAAKYPVVTAYQVHPGILMIARYGDSGQVCEMTLEKLHHEAPDTIDLISTIPTSLIDQLTEELVPPSETGKPTSPWLDTDSYVAGGVSFFKRDFENISIEMHGDYSCKKNESSAGQLACDGGDEVVVIRWKKRACAPSKTNATLPAKRSSRDGHS